MRITDKEIVFDCVLQIVCLLRELLFLELCAASAAAAVVVVGYCCCCCPRAPLLLVFSHFRNHKYTNITLTKCCGVDSEAVSIGIQLETIDFLRYGAGPFILNFLFILVMRKWDFVRFHFDTPSQFHLAKCIYIENSYALLLQFGQLNKK